MSQPHLIVALPNKGRLADATLDFLNKCALNVKRENKRQYQCPLVGISEGVDVVFQRAQDIPRVVKEGRVDLGITGYDIFWENGGESEKAFSVFPDNRDEEKRKVTPLPYGGCSLVIAVPLHWVDIDSIYDLAELSIVKKSQNEILRVATEFPNLTQTYLYNKGVSYFEISQVYGATESAPKMGAAHFISDLKSSGITLSDNKLKEIRGGDILRSSACVIASKTIKDAFKKEKKPPKLTLAKQLIDRFEAQLNSRKYWLITGNVKILGKEKDLKNELTRDLSKKDLGLLGQLGPTIAPVLNIHNDTTNETGKTYSVSIQVKSENLEQAIKILRDKTGRDILVSPTSFVYDNESKAYNSLIARFQKREVKS